MKIAIICDWLVNIGGAEKVLEQMLNCFPEADLFSLVDFIPEDKRHIIKNKLVHVSFLQKMPWAKKYYRSYLPLMPIAIEQFDLSRYDLIISSSHAVAKGVITGPDQLHICYCHSPIRYAWDLQYQYLQESNLNFGIKSWFVRWYLHKIRIWDCRTSNGVDYFLANSKFISRRIHKVYRRVATVIYPPVNTEIVLNEERSNFYLTASRLVPYKKIDLIVEAFAKMPNRELYVIGTGTKLKEIQAKARGFANIKIIGYQSDEMLSSYLARARAFVFAAEEDFGIIPVEAQALGTPVIAYAKGGILESVVGLNDKDIIDNNATGIFFYKQTVDEIITAVEKFEDNADKIKAENCIKNAKNFTTDKFKVEFKQFVLEKFKQFQSDKV